MHQIKLIHVLVVIIVLTNFYFWSIILNKINAVSNFEQHVRIYIDKGFQVQHILDNSLENLNTKVFKNDSHVDCCNN